MARGKKKEELTLEEKLERALVPVEEQPYEVPENWCWTKLRVVSEVVTGSTPSKKKPEYYGEEFPFFKPADLDAGRKTIIASEYLSSEGKKISRVIPAKSTAVCCIGSIGKSGYLEVDGATNQQINSVIPKINSLYLYYFINTEMFINELWEKSSATTISIVNKSKMEQNLVPLPPLQEQQRIVEQIESLFAKLDEAKEKVQEVIDGYAIRETTILQKAVSGELTKGWREKNGISKKAWKVISLKECGNWFGGGTPAKSKNVYWDGGTIPWITSKDMKDRLVEDSLLHITQEGVNHSSAQYCDKPAVLFVMRSGILRRILPVCMVKVPFTVNQDLKAVIPEKIQLEYMYWACTAYEKDIRENCMKSGTTVESIEAKKLFEYELPLPDEREQKVIVGVIENLMCKEESAKQLAVQILKRIDIMKKSILAKVFRGELGTNNLEEESSVKLLKQILEQRKIK